MRNFTICLITLLCGCHGEEEQTVLAGHWHLFDSEIPTTEIYYALDIKSDSIAYLEQINIPNFTHDSQDIPNLYIAEKKMVLYMDGFPIPMMFEYNRDTLFLYDSLFQRQFYAIRNNEEPDQSEYDLFSSSPVKVSLATLTSNNAVTELPDGSYVLNILFGTDVFTGKDTIRIGQSSVAIADIPLAITKYKRRVPQEHIDRMLLVLNIDARYDTLKLINALSKIPSNAFSNVLERRKDSKGEIVFIQHESERTLTNSGGLKYWIPENHRKSLK